MVTARLENRTGSSVSNGADHATESAALIKGSSATIERPRNDEGNLEKGAVAFPFSVKVLSGSTVSC